MLKELQVGHKARAQGYVLVRNCSAYHLWSAKTGHYALRSATLLDVMAYLFPRTSAQPNKAPAQPAKKKIKRVPFLRQEAPKA